MFLLLCSPGFVLLIEPEVIGNEVNASELITPASFKFV